MYVKIERISGIAPGVSPRLIAEQFGQTAQNLDFSSGAFDPIETDLQLDFTLQNSLRRSIYFYDDQYWLEWASDDISVAEAPLANDSFNRLYWTGQDYPRVGTQGSMISGASGYPAASWRLGVPAPATAPTLTVTGTADTSQVPNEVSYVYTFVTDLGEEGPPSPPSAVISVTDTETVAVAMPSAAHPAGNYNFSTGALKRIYRSNTGSERTEYQFVAEVPFATTSYNDVLASSFLGELLPSNTWVAPPDDNTSLYPDGPLQGLIFVANGIMAGFAGRTVCFSVPYLPHAWPFEYRYAIKRPIVGIGTTPNGIVALTTGKPVFVTGADPGSMTQVEIDFAQACVNKNSIVDMGDYLLYASPDGLCAIENVQTKVVSEGIISISQWRADFKPELIRAFLHEGDYVAFWTDGAAHGGWVFSPGDTESAFSTLTASAETRGGFYNPKTGVLYRIIGNKIHAHRQGASVREATWKSKKYVMPRPTAMSWLYVAARAYPATVKVYGDGVKLADYTFALSGGQLQQTVNAVSPVTVNLYEPLVRMPATPATEWEIEIISQAIVDRVILSETLEEIKSA